MKSKYIMRSLLIGIVLAVILNFVTLPYYVTRPGDAQVLRPLVTVEDGYEDEGSFMLTTVKMGKANIFTYAIAKVSEYQNIFPINQIRSEDESDEEYSYRQLHMMESSKETAIKIAYEKAGKEVEMLSKGVYVFSVKEGLAAEGKLKIGDRITHIDGEATATAENLMEFVGEKSIGDEIVLTFDRDEKEETTTITLGEHPEDPNRAGLGISLLTDYEITMNPPITINTAQIGGPSAGLMFSLEIYNQLLEEDIAKGYQIAGTGAVNENGEVQRIGGIAQKIVAADKSGVDIFFAPNEKGAEGSNYQEAIVAAEDIKTTMKIVPVDTFDEAVEYLEQLDPKS
ncbi:PDZ domain-containing protein [Sutcliffiella horikoshii]|uniref:SepM family pheromone-processing serine protease n=1 Tax=Sutcliffiella horikoshii TaxID=79883 RepID=UPI00203D58FB|nr:SepM family pheromone-processing serine protease [Sutcliffiella horikoshii]MCM3616375.1 PDZ domain-containing protein [Sutcliffiella horikoshii]